MQEKRKYIRITPSGSIALKFKVVPDKKSEITFKKGRSYVKNISSGGMFIEMPYLKSKVLGDLLSGKIR